MFLLSILCTFCPRSPELTTCASDPCKCNARSTSREENIDMPSIATNGPTRGLQGRPCPLSVLGQRLPIAAVQRAANVQNVRRGLQRRRPVGLVPRAFAPAQSPTNLATTGALRTTPAFLFILMGFVIRGAQREAFGRDSAVLGLVRRALTTVQKEKPPAAGGVYKALGGFVGGYWATTCLDRNLHGDAALGGSELLNFADFIRCH